MSTASQTAHQAKDQAQSTFHKAEEKVSQQVNSLSDRYVAPVADYTKRSMRDKPVMSGLILTFVAFSAVPLAMYAAFATTVLALVGAFIVLPVLAFGGLFLGGALFVAGLSAMTVTFWTFMAYATLRLVINGMQRETMGSALTHWMTELRDSLMGSSDPSWRRDAKHAKDQAKERVQGR